MMLRRLLRCSLSIAAPSMRLPETILAPSIDGKVAVGSAINQLMHYSSGPAGGYAAGSRVQQYGGGKGGSFESSDDFERRLFGDLDGGGNNDTFFQKLDKAEKSFARSNVGQELSGDVDSDFDEELDGTFDSTDDGMDEELKESCRKFFKHSDEIYEDDYAFRPDVHFKEGDTYDLADLDLTKPAIRRPPQIREFKTTTEEVLRKADFRNVRFLSNFITEAGIIIKRSQTRISAKAQRKVAREIKTARALGLMPFTSMGTKTFVFGKNMKDQDEEYEYSTYDDPIDVDSLRDVEPIRG